MMQRVTALKNWGYSLTLFFLALTGFAQMPIFKRYYLADIPGLGWLAKFYVTHSLHYVFGAVFVSIIIYSATVSLAIKSGRARMGILKFLKGGAVFGLIITGGFLVVKNLKGAYFSHSLIIAMDIGHLICCLLLLGVLFLDKIGRRNPSAE